MVDVSAKAVTARTATASGRVRVSAEVVRLLREFQQGGADSGGGLPKGDALGVARVAGIMAAKRTPDLIPLCHPIAVTRVEVELRVADDGVDISATVGTADRTGVEMEALSAVAVAALTVIDMVKAVDKGAVVERVRLETKDGGRRGPWRRGSGGGQR
jgi:cyclic pyranopterin phosphate synthase